MILKTIKTKKTNSKPEICPKCRQVHVKREGKRQGVAVIFMYAAINHRLNGAGAGNCVGWICKNCGAYDVQVEVVKDSVVL